MEYQKITKKIVGKTITAVFTIEGKPESVRLTLEKEAKDKLAEQIDRYNKKPTKTGQERLYKLFHPKAEAAKTKLIATKKAAKHKVKEAAKELGVSNESDQKLDAALKDIELLKQMDELNVKSIADKDKEIEELKAKLEKGGEATKEVKQQVSQPTQHVRRGEY